MSDWLAVCNPFLSVFLDINKDKEYDKMVSFCFVYMSPKEKCKESCSQIDSLHTFLVLQMLSLKGRNCAP